MSAISKLYQFFWEYSQNPTFVVSLDSFSIVNVNFSAERLTGFSQAELIGKSPFSLYTPENQTLLEQLCNGNYASHSVRNLQLVCKDLSLIPIELTTSDVFDTGESLLILCMLRDTREQDKHETLLAAKNWALSAYSEAISALYTCHSPDELMSTICQVIVREPNYLLAWIGVGEDISGKPISRLAAAGSAIGYLDNISLSWDENLPFGHGPTGTCVRTKKPVVIPDFQKSQAFSFWLERANQFNLRSTTAVPLTINHKPAALMVYANHADAFNDDVIKIFERLAQQIETGLYSLAQQEQLAIESSRLQSAELQLTTVLKTTVAAMATTMESRDPYTSGHQTRVADIAVAIGAELGWDNERLRGLKIAATVHDIGKIGIPIEILTKPSRLTANEHALIKEHPDIGYNILKDIPFPWPIADVVRQHHEKLDGSGYPLGLQGEEIIPEARVLAIADIIDSMATYRPYRPALGIDVALAEIERLAGPKLDADIAAKAIALFREKGYKLPPHH